MGPCAPLHSSVPCINQVANWRSLPCMLSLADFADGCNEASLQETSFQPQGQSRWHKCHSPLKYRPTNLAMSFIKETQPTTLGHNSPPKWGLPQGPLCKHGSGCKICTQNGNPGKWKHALNVWSHLWFNFDPPPNHPHMEAIA